MSCHSAEAIGFVSSDRLGRISSHCDVEHETNISDVQQETRHTRALGSTAIKSGIRTESTESTCEKPFAVLTTTTDTVPSSLSDAHSTRVSFDYR